MNKLLMYLTRNLPLRIISDDGQPYLERYYLFTLLGWRFYVHRFVGSDPARGLHDHPWSRAFSIILSGWYYEETRSGVRKVRWLNHLVGDNFHRVVLPAGAAENENGFVRLLRAECWTLFFHRAGDVKRWGFLEKVEGFPDARLFVPYDYKKEGSQVAWWETAKSRAELSQ